MKPQTNFTPLADHLFLTAYLNKGNLDEDDFDLYFGHERDEDAFGDEEIPLENLEDY